MPLEKAYLHHPFADSPSSFTELMLRAVLQDTVVFALFNLPLPVFTCTFSNVTPVVIPRNKYTEGHMWSAKIIMTAL